MQKPSKLVGKVQINGKDVSFFAPPHNEPDFLWVDIEELALAFLPADEAKRMVQHSQNFGEDERMVAMAVNGDRIATIFCHAMAQGFSGFIDQIKSGKKKSKRTMNGPAFNAYVFASAEMEIKHAPKKTFEDIFAAFDNNGGPFMRGMRDRKKGKTPSR